MELFLPFPQIPLEKNGSWNWFFCDRIHSGGINRLTRCPTSLLFSFFRNVYGHCDGKFELDHPNWVEFTPAHTYVFFPL